MVRTDRKIRVAPARGGKPFASPWRFWSQGDEFYAAPRNYIRLGKFSFHRAGRWQYELGGKRFRLAPSVQLSNGWKHVLQISFLAEGNFLPMLHDKLKDIFLVETPPLHKMLIDLALSDRKSANYTLPRELSTGNLFAKLPLRSGHAVLLIARLAPATLEDLARIEDHHKKLAVSLAEQTNPECFFAETILQKFSPASGNVLQIFPVVHKCCA